MLEALADAGIRVTAKSRVQDVTNEQIALLARETYGMGFALAPEAWRNQLASSAHHRTESFNQLGYALERRFNPQRDSLTPTALREYARRGIDSQVDRRGTLLSTLGHVYPITNALARETEVRLVEEAARYFNSEGLREPSPDDPYQTPRALYATLIVKATELIDEHVADLIRRYSSLAVNGYWIWINGMSYSAPDARRVARLVFGLEQIAERPVLLSGLGPMHLAFLASGIAATSVGFGENERFNYPPTPPPKRDATDGRPRRLVIYHDEAMRNFTFRKSGAWAEILRRAFSEFPCDCGAHPPNLPPEDNSITKRHTMALMLRTVSEIRAEPPVAEAWLENRLARARNMRNWLRLPRLDLGWGVVAPTANAIRAGEVDLDTASGAV